MPKTLFVFFLGLFCSPLFAQTPHTVIAVSGLKLRATPDRESRVLALAPFGAKVMVKNEYRPTPDGKRQSYQPEARRDTIGILRENDSFGRKIQEPHIGYWLSVVYEGKSGYMFSGFLLPEQAREATPPYPNEDWRVQFATGNACSSASPDMEKHWNWYGLFRESDGKYALRSVRLQYAIADYTDEHGEAEIIDREVITQTPGVSGTSLFLVGYSGKLKERSGISGADLFRSQDDPKLQKLASLQPYGIAVQKNSPIHDWDYTVFATSVSGKKQKLGMPDMEGSPEVYWAGDLDGDGRYDYLCSEGDKFGGTTLYLSTLAKPDEMVGLAAVLYQWNCN